MIVLIRHASIVDTLLPANLVARPHRIRLRYVLKRELLADPCLDVAGRRLPNYFVRRGTGEAQEVGRVRALAHGLGPERRRADLPGGRPASRPSVAPARLRASPSATPVWPRGRSGSGICCRRDSAAWGLCSTAHRTPTSSLIAHHGFDGLRLISDIWRGGLVGLVVRVRVTRVPRSKVPEAGTARADWLYDLWQDVDDWLGQRFAGAPTRTAA